MSQNTDDDENDVEEESEQLRLWQNELEFLNLWMTQHSKAWVHVAHIYTYAVDLQTHHEDAEFGKYSSNAILDSQIIE